MRSLYFGRMPATVVLLFFGLYGLGPGGGAVANGQGGQTSLDHLKMTEERFQTYHKDFLDFAQSGLFAGSSEFDSARELGRTADETGVFISDAEGLIAIYNAISCKEDKSRIRSMIRAQLGFYSHRIESSIKETNLELVNISRAAPRDEAARMLDDLRALQGFLDSIDLQ